MFVPTNLRLCHHQLLLLWNDTAAPAVLCWQGTPSSLDRQTRKDAGGYLWSCFLKILSSAIRSSCNNELVSFCHLPWKLFFPFLCVRARARERVPANSLSNRSSKQPWRAVFWWVQWRRSNPSYLDSSGEGWSPPHRTLTHLRYLNPILGVMLHRCHFIPFVSLRSRSCVSSKRSPRHGHVTATSYLRPLRFPRRRWVRRLFMQRYRGAWSFSSRWPQGGAATQFEKRPGVQNQNQNSFYCNCAKKGTTK